MSIPSVCAALSHLVRCPGVGVLFPASKPWRFSPAPERVSPKRGESFGPTPFGPFGSTTRPVRAGAVGFGAVRCLRRCASFRRHLPPRVLPFSLSRFPFSRWAKGKNARPVGGCGPTAFGGGSPGFWCGQPCRSPIVAAASRSSVVPQAATLTLPQRIVRRRGLTFSNICAIMV